MYPVRISLLSVSLVVLLLAGACQPQPDAPAPPAPAATAPAAPDSVERLSADTFVDRHTSDAVVLDVRTPEEFAQGHLSAAHNIDVKADDFRARVDRLDRDGTYYLYCRTGNRSGQAAEIMHEMGFTNLYNIGGFQELAAAGAETESLN